MRYLSDEECMDNATDPENIGFLHAVFEVDENFFEVYVNEDVEDIIQ